MVIFPIFFLYFRNIFGFAVGNVPGQPCAQCTPVYDDDFIAAIFGSEGYLCTGNVVSRNFVLTAASCFIGSCPRNKIIVDAGNPDLNIKGQRRGVYKIIVHENYNPGVLQNNIAVVGLNRPLEFDVDVAPIALDTNFATFGSGVTIIGWGWGPESRVNMIDKVPSTVQNFNCSTFLDRSIEIGAVSIANNSAKTCRRDTGSALVNLNGNLVGILSKKLDACGDNSCEVFTRISHYLDWILINTDFEVNVVGDWNGNGAEWYRDYYFNRYCRPESIPIRECRIRNIPIRSFPFRNYGIRSCGSNC